jgi:hypothetical protein
VLLLPLSLPFKGSLIHYSDFWLHPTFYWFIQNSDSSHPFWP